LCAELFSLREHDDVKRRAEKILVVEDEEAIAELIEYNLLKAGYQVLLSASGEDALSLARSEQPALVLLDIMLPDLDGLEVCRRLKREPALRKARIIMVTAKGEEDHIVAGLEAGADDYIVKPFSPRVLVARVEAVLRRESESSTPQEDVIRVHSVEIHRGKREVRVQGKPVALTFSEFSILLHLAVRPGWVFTRSQIISALHGNDHHVTEKTVDVHILGLRKKLGAAGELVEAVRGVGYRFRE
jgi:two-component system phosphate regulon response regulator PhoB